ncbi:hypothetical protein Glove_283g47 [Diversispora epigaea]|uniref:Uncharacterized protein n=1 Tax=Diversispora epigaea TaxID=1348612 RepID=A0A397I1J3_9GLOM|nr:hypothetical protein Glove_283g47 [Diversispora epigaea]
MRKRWLERATLNTLKNQPGDRKINTNIAVMIMPFQSSEQSEDHWTTQEGYYEDIKLWKVDIFFEELNIIDVDNIQDHQEGNNKIDHIINNLNVTLYLLLKA